MLTVVFDLDGTLIDTAPDLIDTLNVTLKREGLQAVAYDDARPQRPLQFPGILRVQYLEHLSEYVALEFSRNSRPLRRVRPTRTAVGEFTDEID